MKWPRVVLLAAVGALCVWAWMALHPSAEKQIRKQIEGLARTASFGSGQGTLTKVAASEHLADFFSTNVEIGIDLPRHQEHQLIGRTEIPQLAMRTREAVSSLSVTFPDVTVIVNADQESAVADATLQIKIGGEADMIIQEVKISLRKIDSRWLIVKVETVRTLQQ